MVMLPSAGALSMLSAQDTTAQLSCGRGRPVPALATVAGGAFPAPPTVHALFEACARATPDALAVAV